MVQEPCRKKPRPGDWREPINSEKRVWALQEAWHAQAKSEGRSAHRRGNRSWGESMNTLERKPDALCGVGNYVAQTLKNQAFIGAWTPPTPHNILHL